MSDLDQILDQCLTDIASGASTLDDCLTRHPEHAAQLGPLLAAATRLRADGEVHPSAAFKARARAKLTLHMQSHPRRKPRTSFAFRRLAAGFAAVLLALLVTGTVYAQGALPGDSLYSWKLVSERAWRIVSSDVVGTDLLIANRRINEMNVTVNNPAHWSRALEGYKEVRTRLESELDSQTLESILPPIDSFYYPEQATPIPAESATPFIEDPEIVATSVPPDKQPTKKPKIVPTINIPPPFR